MSYANAINPTGAINPRAGSADSQRWNTGGRSHVNGHVNTGAHGNILGFLGYSDHSDCGQNYTYQPAHYNTGHGNHHYINESYHTNYSQYGGYGYTYCYNYTYGCKNHIDYGNSGYSNHADFYYCKQVYANHSNGEISAPESYNIEINNPGIDNWIEIRDAVADINKLHREITRLSTKKVRSNNSIPISVTPSETENATSNFTTSGSPAKASQINETINNINYLWEAIKGTSGPDDNPNPIATKNIGDKMQKADYAEILRRAQDLAQVEQPSDWKETTHKYETSTSYRNHSDSLMSPNTIAPADSGFYYAQDKKYTDYANVRRTDYANTEPPYTSGSYLNTTEDHSAPCSQCNHRCNN